MARRADSLYFLHQGQEMTSGNDRHALTFVLFFSFICLAFVQAIYGRWFPWSDDWFLMGVASGAEPLSWGWLFAQHVDHVIPIQKLAQVAVLRIGGWDARALILLNSILALAAASFLIESVSRYRGETRFGDAMLPLVFLSPAFPPFGWGFQLQFLSSTSLAMTFLGCLLRTKGEAPAVSDRYFLLSALTLLPMVFCGMNGLVSAIVLALLSIAYAIHRKPINGSYLAYCYFALLAIVLVATAMVVFAWRPSPASSGVASLATRDGVAGILRSSLLLLFPSSLSLTINKWGGFFLFCGVLYVAGAWFFFAKPHACRRRGETLEVGWWAVLAVALATIATLASAAIGRSGYWTPGLEKHYSYLASPLPVLAWFAVSFFAPEKFSRVLGPIVVVFFLYVYVASLESYLRRGQEIRIQNFDVVVDLGSGATVRDFVAKNAGIVFFRDDSRVRANLESIIERLRRAGVDPYARLTQ